MTVLSTSLNITGAEEKVCNEFFFFNYFTILKM